jgi:predicted TIM-barrel fold metal-dependent hydrolase
MTQLASFPNVWTKISGIATEADLMNWTADDIKPYVDHALSVFGEDRVAFGGDWPPILTANSTYARWVQTLDDLTSGMGAAGQRKLFETTRAASSAFHRHRPFARLRQQDISTSSMRSPGPGRSDTP